MARAMPEVGRVFVQAESEIGAINMAPRRRRDRREGPRLHVQPRHEPDGRGDELHGRLGAPARAHQRHARRPGPRQHRAVAVRLLPGDQGPRPRRLPRAGARARPRSPRRSRSSPTPSRSRRATGRRSCSSPTGSWARRWSRSCPTFRTPALGHQRVGSSTGADGRRAARRPLAPPPARGPRAPQRPPPGQVRDDHRARGPLGGRAPRGRRDRRRRLRHRRPRGPDGHRARPRRTASASACSGRSPCGRSLPQALAELAPRLRAILVVELSAGQMVEDVRLAVEGATPVFFHGRTGGMVPTPGEVVDASAPVRLGHSRQPPIQPPV